MVSDEILLLISSSRILMEMTKKKLERTGYTVRCADETAEVWNCISDLAPCGIILLNDSQDGSGIKLCRELRNVTNSPIMYTSNSKDDELAALQAGANDFLKKPFDYDIMAARVNIMLRAKVGVITKLTEQDDYSIKTASETAVEQTIPQTVKQQPGAPADNDSKRVLRLRMGYVVAAACLIVAVIAAGIIFTLSNGGRNTEINDFNMPLAELPFPFEVDN